MAKQKQRSSIDIFKEILSRNLLEAPTYNPLPAGQLPTPKTDFAQYLLNASVGQKKAARDSLNHREGALTEEPSALNRFFDYISAPLYTTYNVADDLLDEGSDSFLEEAKDLGANLAGGAARLAKPLVKPVFNIPGIGDDMEKEYDAFVDRNNTPKLGHEILENAGVDNPIAKYGGGFLLDVAADPLTYAPGVGFARAGSKFRNARAAMESPVEEITAKAAVSNPEVFARPPKPQNIVPPVAETLTRSAGPQKITDFPQVSVADRVAPPVARPVDQDFSWGVGDIVNRITNSPEDMAAMKKMQRSDNARRAANIRHGNPEDAVHNPRPATIIENAEFVDRLRQGKLAKAGKVTDGKGNVSTVSVSRVIEDIQTGSLPRFGPEPARATGDVARNAESIADDFLTQNLLPATGKKRIDLNPANQANLYNRMFSATESLVKGASTKKGLRKRRVLARQMLRSAEDHMIRLGKHPVFWNGMRVRLSDVLEEVGIEANEELATRVMTAFVNKDMTKIKEPEVAEAINRALARRSLANADLLENLSSHAARAKASILDNYSFPKAQHILNTMPEAAAEAMRHVGMSEAEVSAVADLARNIIDVDKLPTDKLMDSLQKELVKAVADKRVAAEVVHKFNKAVIRTIGETPEKLSKSITGVKAVDSFMTRMTTWYGRGEMKNFSQDVFTWGEMNAVMRARWLRNMAKGHSQAEIVTAFRAAQFPEILSTISPKEQALAAKFTDYFETMLGSSGIEKIYEGGNVATRAGLGMELVNKHLKSVGSNFVFRNDAKTKNIMGTPRDYSEKGLGWMKYWENADPKKAGQDPITLMYDIDLAIERATKEVALVDEFAMRFGAKVGDAHYNPKTHVAGVGHPRLKDYKFPQKERDEMQRLLHDLENDIFRPNNQIVRHYSRGLRAWKTGVTIYLPSHHIRNMIGDLHLMWWAGHSDPRDFIRARRVMGSQRAKYKDALHSDSLDQLKGLVDADAMKWAATQPTDTIIRRNGVEVTAEQIYIAAHQHGLLLDANKLEDIFGAAPLGKIQGSDSTLKQIAKQPLGGKAHHAASVAAEYREHFVRLSHFIAATNKGLKKSKDIAKVFDDAAHEVRKWHPDGRDLTTFEQGARLAIPFYSWTRKAIPLVVQAAVQNPAKILYYPKASLAMQGLMGIEGGTMLDPFPDDQLFPDWIRAKGIGPVADPESENAVSAWWGKLGRNALGMHGQEVGYTITNPSNPFQDLVEMFGHIEGTPLDAFKGAFESMTPAAKIPVDLAMDKKFSGAPIRQSSGGEGVLSYLLEQVPILSAGNNVLEIGKEVPEGREGGKDTQALINYLTALGVRGTGAYMKSAEFEAADRARQAKE